MSVLDMLNEAQRQAASHIDGAQLILAGAGTGKTRTITTRLAFLIGEVGIHPLNTLTLTFTNKAAQEMRTRALSLLPASPEMRVPLLCTFHKFGLLFLKLHMEHLGRSSSFSIADTDDKKKIIKDLNIESKFPTATVASEISRFKNLLLSPQDLLDYQFERETLSESRSIVLCYKRYEEFKHEKNLVDFDDLLVLPYRILQQENELRRAVSQRYKYIMVDEFQDTNLPQLELLKLLCSEHSNLVVVGDDDQSIYGWRGAKMDNILNFETHFPGAKIVKLEDNYRSTQNILNVANELIDHNRIRLGKTLRATVKEELKVQRFKNQNEIAEANLVASQIQKLLNSGEEPGEIAVLYRVNALSRSIEEALNKHGIGYKMVGGTKFYERTEVKDVVAYLKLVKNPHDDFLLTRIINRPKRNFGEESLKKLNLIAQENTCSLFDALIIALQNGTFTAKTASKLGALLEGLMRLSTLENHEIVAEIDGVFGLKEFYALMPDGESRVANLYEFYGVLKERAKEPEFDLDDFLNDLTLQSDQDELSDTAVSLMSVHASKGLEFKHVFVIGLEEGFFPLRGDEIELEEERRLAYVAFTRAKRNLSLFTSSYRIYRGQKQWLEPSRFLSEAGVAEGGLQIERVCEFKKGDRVEHKIFGKGYVMQVVPDVRDKFKLIIMFSGGEREIMSGFVTKV